MNKGFTLIEILVSVFIIGLILVITIPSYLYVYNTTRDANYRNKVNYMNQRAIAYGETIKDDIKNNTCKDISIAELIRKGYISSDYKNKEALQNPITNQEFDDTLEVCYCKSDNNLKVFNYNTFYYKNGYTKGERVKYGTANYECMSSYSYDDILMQIQSNKNKKIDKIEEVVNAPCQGYYNSELNLCITSTGTINESYLIANFFKKLEC